MLPDDFCNVLDKPRGIRLVGWLAGWLSLSLYFHFHLHFTESDRGEWCATFFAPGPVLKKLRTTRPGLTQTGASGAQLLCFPPVSVRSQQKTSCIALGHNFVFY